ncbi:MAG: M48 family metallopeptidase [Methanobacteriaceae archaeon]|nr:M48 family metallopeptidase [Methanobacteriaceae archaeon]
MERKQLYQLHSREYEHKFDRIALETLEKTPGIKSVVKKFNKHAIERDSRLIFSGSCLKVTERSFPYIYELLEEVCRNLYLKNIPDLYLQPGDEVNAFSTGSENPLIVLNSGTIDSLSSEELLYVLGHEVGHIKSGHLLYHELAKIIPYIGEIAGSATPLGIGKILSKGLKYPLIHWTKMSQFSADRAGMLACQDLDSVMSTLMKISGLPKKYTQQISNDVFINQAKNFKNFDYNSLNSMDKILLSLDDKHSWSIMRAAELLKWFESGKYGQVLEKHSLESVKEINSSLYCLSCGFELLREDNFCPGCGERIGRR